MVVLSHGQRPTETISVPIMGHLISTNPAVVPGPIMNNKDKSSVTLVLNTHLADNRREKVDNFPRSRYEPGLEVMYVATPNCKRILQEDLEILV